MSLHFLAQMKSNLSTYHLYNGMQCPDPVSDAINLIYQAHKTETIYMAKSPWFEWTDPPPGLEQAFVLWSHLEQHNSRVDRFAE